MQLLPKRSPGSPRRDAGHGRRPRGSYQPGAKRRRRHGHARRYGRQRGRPPDTGRIWYGTDSLPITITGTLTRSRDRGRYGGTSA